MDFRYLVLGLLLWLPNVHSSPMKQMDELVPLISQSPSKAYEKINYLQSKQSDTLSPRESLRLNVLKCFTLITLGESKAAINLALLGAAKAKSSNISEAQPYFLTCMSEANIDLGNFKEGLPLLDTSIALSKEYQQPQALSYALRMRAQHGTNSEDYGSVIEDLRLMLDVYRDIFTQKNNWFWSSEAYIYLTAANFWYSSGDLENGLKYLSLSLNAKDSIGAIHHRILLTASKINFHTNNFEISKAQLTEAKASISSLDSSLEMAYSYAIIASIHVDFGQFNQAESFVLLALTKMKSRFKFIDVMRVNRLLAQIKFSQGKPEEALKLMKTIVAQANRLKQYGDLKEFYHILKDYYLSQNDYPKAYEYLNKALEATNEANKTLNSARFIQYKARLDRQAALNNKDKFSEFKSKPTRNLLYDQWMIVAATFVTLIIIALFVLGNHRKKLATKRKAKANEKRTIFTQLDEILNQAKFNEYPLSLLLVDISKLTDNQYEKLEQGGNDVLREQDFMVRYSDTEWLILLPHTTNAGCHRIIRQFQINLKQYTNDEHIFGMSSLQQFDSLDSLIKRANLDRLTQFKNRQIRVNSFESQAS
ncbi:hypothetical protein D5R81_04010 [Parashewanella spongiae]|uniref:GGDEF domain-containing protein n=1 Tax=Parashewanella spongiae TaxID=342950 RepID=A0A3A6UB14_9GAMM|nr:tetratricopeptide repeat protein [Parashewanella spongiae]MCL1077023.1 tetratricopeptide repeat protein [Parashewanella spongiae]RJY18763.1 hypothetical protein D5R81_04010 [Parashewanella spongiae]